ncbi:lanthionine synthetase LanC family protein [Bifidobacterium olomucense]|uniref:Lanthionine synthetase C-like protein n=1 Tax=Bifidobacterium olomucense TaxID=2675324 RepID=A0A7Y0EYD4_9BIFI|nr:lanthionine synthetase LanC family protein [Bifidobacterium sp. DSM 109959]NMM98398.1 lanthionine synthetase C-like protein [Bifidobacterium sp. DSM 109959]
MTDYGTLFPTTTADSAEQYLELAQDAERSISQYAHTHADGVYWTTEPNAPLDLSRYHGSTGIVEFYANLYQATGNSTYGEIFAKAARFAALHWRDILLPDNVAALQRQESLPELGKSVDFGVGGVAESLRRAWYAVSQDPSAQDFDQDLKNTIETALAQIAQWYLLIAESGENGVHWANNSAQLFDGGIIEILIDINAILQSNEITTVIAAAGREFLSHGVRQPDGSLDFDAFAQIAERNYWRDKYYESLTGDARTGGFVEPATIANYQRLIGSHRPNFSYGPAGAGFTLLRLYHETGDRSYLDGAKQAALFLTNHAVSQAKGFLSPHDLNTGRDLFYAGECNGIAGTAKLFLSLYALTDDESYLDTVKGYVEGLESIGVPEHQSPGLWNNVCQCCGHAGLVHFFLSLNEIHQDEHWLELANRAASVLLGTAKVTRSESGDQAIWPIAWSRLNPTRIGRPIGLRDGAAGVASSLLELYLADKGEHLPRAYDDIGFWK